MPPSISSTSGTWTDNSSVTISGSGFGSKGGPDANKPIVWADFEANISPTSLGIATAWDENSNMVQVTGEAVAGNGVAKGNAGGTPWTLRFDPRGPAFVGTDLQWSYIFYLVKMNFVITDTSQNWKNFRYWAYSSEGTLDNFPNTYMAPSNGRVFTEGLGAPDPGFFGSATAQRLPDTLWHITEFFFQASELGVKNGSIEIRYDGVSMDSGAIRTKDSTDPDILKKAYLFHMVAANTASWTPAWSTANQVWCDDLYFDLTRSRVMVGNASTLATSTKLSPQIPSSWTDTSLTVTVHQGLFGPTESAWLYVVDSNNVASVGFVITFGTGSGGTRPVAQNRPAVSTKPVSLNRPGVLNRPAL